ncbi:MAG TPA: VTT domain-containing protein [Casimicrobiaceae bacterium]|jgi:membrane-associated protein|nr:VTT domain-containing protein [Casimicrobiaceae bacterium]
MITALIYSLFALDETVAQFASQYGAWLYLLLFFVIFAETGLVVFPVLPGDSILFIAGTVVALADLNVHVLVFVLAAAAILGDSVNYAVGHFIGPKVFERPESRWLRKDHLRRTQAFYERFGGITIVIGRFVPVIRTFAPFLAGVAGMPYSRFLPYNVVGGAMWISSLVYAGYLFGNIPWVKHNLTWIVLAFVVVSLTPATITYLKERKARKAAAASNAPRE